MQMHPEWLPNGFLRVTDRASGLVALFNGDMTPRNSVAYLPDFNAYANRLRDNMGLPYAYH